MIAVGRKSNQYTRLRILAGSNFLSTLRRIFGRGMLLKLSGTIDCDAFLAHAKALRQGLSFELKLPSADRAVQDIEVVGGPE